MKAPAATSVHGSLRNQVYTELRNRIVSGKYDRGTALTEIRISSELGVSRTPVREAFSQLQLDGLVIATPNKGVVVEGLDQNDLMDWYEIRVAMESMAAAKAALNMTPEIARELKRTIDQAQDLVDKGLTHDLIQLDARFHDLIFKSSGSRVLQNFLNPIAHYTSQSRQVSLARQSRAEEVIEEHRRILEALQNHDVRLARLEMAKHINHAAESFQKMTSSPISLEESPLAGGQ